MENKSLFTSKTIIVSIVVFVGGVVGKYNPEVGEFIKQNAADILAGLGMVFAGLRMITAGKVNIPWFESKNDEPKA